MIERVQYYTQEQQEPLIKEYSLQGKLLVGAENITEGRFLIFTSNQDEADNYFKSPVSDTESIAVLQHKVVEQDTLLEEILFVIIPEMMGGGM